jgi:hypothetical protein
MTENGPAAQTGTETETADRPAGTEIASEASQPGLGSPQNLTAAAAGLAPGQIAADHAGKRCAHSRTAS